MPVKDREVILTEAGLPGSMPSEAMPADRTQRRAAVGGSKRVERVMRTRADPASCSIKQSYDYMGSLRGTQCAWSSNGVLSIVQWSQGPYVGPTAKETDSERRRHLRDGRAEMAQALEVILLVAAGVAAFLARQAISRIGRRRR
jgi:hypothetical protein